jgi:hypothetical protein
METRLLKILAATMLVTLYAPVAFAATITAASCSRSDVQAAIASASSGDIVYVPAADCASSNAWTSTIVVSKPLTILGAGIGRTNIGLGFGGPAFRIASSDVRISGFTLDCKYKPTTNAGFIMVGIGDGTNSCTDGYEYSDFRIDNNRFLHCDEGTVGTLGYNAITVRGLSYGVIDHNIFDDCTGECLDIQQDGYLSMARTNETGQYSVSKTIYVEDNTWNYMSARGDGGCENALDSNDGARWVFRYNMINVTGAASVHQIVSTHDCAVGDVCDAATQDSANNPMVEIYGNRIYNQNDGAWVLYAWRSGHAYIYNNTYYFGNPGQLVQAYNVRAGHRPGCNAQFHRGYGQFCFEDDGSGLLHEGLVSGKTSLSDAIGATGCPTLTSVEGFPVVGSMRIGNEQIDYRGVSGNQLTGCTRGAFQTTATSHSPGSSVDLFLWGICADQPTEGWIWNNMYCDQLDCRTNPSHTGSDLNTVLVDNQENTPDYESYTIMSYAERPENWQYRNDGTPYVYAPYTYPHPLTRKTDNSTCTPVSFWDSAPCDGCLSAGELLPAIHSWRSSGAISLTQLMEVILSWKRNC